MNTVRQKNKFKYQRFYFWSSSLIFSQLWRADEKVYKNQYKTKEIHGPQKTPVHSVYFICIRHMLIWYNPLCDKFLPRPCIFFLCGCFCAQSGEECITRQTMLFVHNFPQFTTKHSGVKTIRLIRDKKRKISRKIEQLGVFVMGCFLRRITFLYNFKYIKTLMKACFNV